MGVHEGSTSWRQPPFTKDPDPLWPDGKCPRRLVIRFDGIKQESEALGPTDFNGTFHLYRNLINYWSWSTQFIVMRIYITAAGFELIWQYKFGYDIFHFSSPQAFPSEIVNDLDPATHLFSGGKGSVSYIADVGNGFGSEALLSSIGAERQRTIIQVQPYHRLPKYSGGIYRKGFRVSHKGHSADCTTLNVGSRYHGSSCKIKLFNPIIVGA